MATEGDIDIERHIASRKSLAASFEARAPDQRMQTLFSKWQVNVEPTCVCSIIKFIIVFKYWIIDIDCVHIFNAISYSFAFSFAYFGRVHRQLLAATCLCRNHTNIRFLCIYCSLFSLCFYGIMQLNWICNGDFLIAIILSIIITFCVYVS